VIAADGIVLVASMGDPFGDGNPEYPIRWGIVVAVGSGELPMPLENGDILGFTLAMASDIGIVMEARPLIAVPFGSIKCAADPGFLKEES
jgi:hypothetical protein